MYEEPIDKTLQSGLETWIKESDFELEVDSEEGMATLLGFISDKEKELVTTGIVHEVLADFLDWCGKNVSYEAWAIRAMVHDYLKYSYSARLRYWE